MKDATLGFFQISAENQLPQIIIVLSHELLFDGIKLFFWHRFSDWMEQSCYQITIFSLDACQGNAPRVRHALPLVSSLYAYPNHQRWQHQNR